MATLSFTPNLLRHVEVSSVAVEGKTLREALEKYFAVNPKVRGYVLDDQGSVRKHVAIFLNQEIIGDRVGLSDTLHESDDIFIAQALSGG